MSEKVTAYDLSYLHSNPFENITSEILLANLPRVDVNFNINGSIGDNFTDDVDKEECQIKKSLISDISNYLKSYLFPKDDDPLAHEIANLHMKQANALNYKEWLDASLQLDVLENYDSWKEIKESSLYDYEAVERQLNEMRECRINKDFHKMLYIIRTSWKRDFAGINNEKLYNKCHVGTKNLITEYIDECVTCLASLVSEDCPLEDEYVLGVLLESKRNYGRAAITMSGGGTFGLIGIGVFSTLLEIDLFPKIISGSSCGSIVSAIMCSKTSGEIKSILTNLFDKTFEVFNVENDNDTFYTHLSRFLKFGVWFDSKYLQQTMKEFLSNITFKEAYNKTGRILNITVSSATIHDQPTLLNYLTAPNVLIWSAVCASCSLPLVFASSTIYEKNTETGEIHEWSNQSLKFVDGSLNSDLPISRLSEMFNVNHTIACQVNPHIAPLVKLSADCNDVNKTSKWNIKKLFYTFSSILSLELSHYCELLNELGIMSNLATKIRQLIIQSYKGDITILPELKLGEQSKTLVNPTPTFIWKCVLKGARATWPKISMIRDQYTVEFSMDKYISVLKSRVVFDSMKNKVKNNESSISCDPSPKKSLQLSPLKIPKNLSINDYDEYRKRGETITLSEKFRHDDSFNISPRKFGTYSKTRPNSKNSKKGIKQIRAKESSKLKPDHSFESLRNIQKKNSLYDINVAETASKSRHYRSFSYSQLGDARSPPLSRDRIIDCKNNENLEEGLIMITNNNNNTKTLSVSSVVLKEKEELRSGKQLPISFNKEESVLIYPGENRKFKNKKE
jgi:TAG lipase/steryl ester hydrolase/phospholipase A2/LPA acyltransferase